MLPLHVCSVFTGFLQTKSLFFKSCKNGGRSFCRPLGFPRWQSPLGQLFHPSRPVAWPLVSESPLDRDNESRLYFRMSKFLPSMLSLKIKPVFFLLLQLLRKKCPSKHTILCSSRHMRPETMLTMKPTVSHHKLGPRQNTSLLLLSVLEVRKYFLEMLKRILLFCLIFFFLSAGIN